MPSCLVSKTPVTIPLPDGSYCALYNDGIGSYDAWYYQDSSATSDLFTKLNTSDQNSMNYRGLVYQIYHDKFVQNAGLSLTVPLLTGEENDDESLISVPLFECISPLATYVNKKGLANLLFWTNLKSGTSFKTNESEYKYDASKILKIKNSEINSFTFEENTVTRALCAVTIEFRPLYVKYSISSGETDVKRFPSSLIPIAKDIVVLKEEMADSPVLDFSTGGGGGGGSSAPISRHAHINNNDCGFAFAVFHPGTGVPLGNPWKN